MTWTSSPDWPHRKVKPVTAPDRLGLVHGWVRHCSLTSLSALRLNMNASSAYTTACRAPQQQHNVKHVIPVHEAAAQVPSMCLSVCLSVCLCVCTCIVRPSVSLLSWSSTDYAWAQSSPNLTQAALHVCLYVCLSVCLCLSVSVCLSVCLCLSDWLTISISFWASVGTYVYFMFFLLTVCLSTWRSVVMSIHIHIPTCICFCLYLCSFLFLGLFLCLCLCLCLASLPTSVPIGDF